MRISRRAHINEYADRFAQKGISYRIVTQENAGVGAAINTALCFVEGEYLCWPDIDDWYSDNAVSVRVAYLKQNPSYSVVTSNADVYKETDLEHPIGTTASSLCGGVAYV